MIVATRKPLAEIRKLLGPSRKILIIGCGACAAECAAGGPDEVAALAAELLSSCAMDGLEPVVREACVDRQCVHQFLPVLAEDVDWCETVLSLGCGAGVQSLVRFYPQTYVVPGLNTQFVGSTLAGGVWTEDCAGCGNCGLALFGGICPVTRCAKRLLNGPCGGSAKGKCEVNPDIDCAWQLIYDRLSALGQLDRLKTVIPPKDWATSLSGGPRTIVRGEGGL